MTKEDYAKYYIQGSDHYLVPSDIFNELIDEMINWREDFKIKRKEKEDLKQALIDINKILTECKMLMPHEFNLEEQTDNILQIIDKVLGGDK